MTVAVVVVASGISDRGFGDIAPGVSSVNDFDDGLQMLSLSRSLSLGFLTVVVRWLWVEVYDMLLLLPGRWAGRCPRGAHHWHETALRAGHQRDCGAC